MVYDVYRKQDMLDMNVSWISQKNTVVCHIPSLQVGLKEWSMINFCWPLCNNCPHNIWQVRGRGGWVGLEWWTWTILWTPMMEWSKCVGLGSMAQNEEQAVTPNCRTLMRDHLIWARCPSQIISALASMDTGGGLQRTEGSLDTRTKESELAAGWLRGKITGCQV